MKGDGNPFLESKAVKKDRGRKVGRGMLGRLKKQLGGWVRRTREGVEPRFLGEREGSGREHWEKRNKKKRERKKKSRKKENPLH